ncbi:FMRFamide peptide receptor frpr-18-like [Biomphalaria glabrata]|uniref:FMRFamide peptide receptor frpr-18-like n=1 Tax=Biomphalaria glabrata TaxID=6526 RepID=A0A9W2ZFB7_BIOGL|nr:FMRFamide peptide receptor frpr-18-like [Biomphalaria glabrata]KAI8786121.1 FMRFamide receptor [Biomphalaria glabrata]
MASNITEGNFLIVNKGVIDSTLVEFFMTFNLMLCAVLIGIAGIVGNVINILNFQKQGLQDSVNVTLTALAVSDIGALFFQLLVNILFNPLWRRVQLPFSSSSVLAMVFFYPHGYFIRVSGFITAFAAFERCLCVVLPMDVKRIITRNVAVVVNIIIFIVLLLYLYPEHSVVYMDWLNIPALNRTVLTFVFRENFEMVMTYTNITNDLFIPYITFLVLIICTVVIVIQLKSKSKWRQSLLEHKLSRGSKTELSIKDKKAVIMLTVVSVLYVSCLTPQCVLITVIGFMQDLKVEGPLWDISLMTISFSSLLETINCSVSFIVYYKMSSKFKETLNSWLPVFKRIS